MAKINNWDNSLNHKQLTNDAQVVQRRTTLIDNWNILGNITLIGPQNIALTHNSQLNTLPLGNGRQAPVNNAVLLGVPGSAEAGYIMADVAAYSPDTRPDTATMTWYDLANYAPGMAGPANAEYTAELRLIVGTITNKVLLSKSFTAGSTWEKRSVTVTFEHPYRELSSYLALDFVAAHPLSAAGQGALVTQVNAFDGPDDEAPLWTVEGDIPPSITKKTAVTLTLNKNGQPAASEKLTVALDTAQYLTVSPETVTTGTDGTFDLTLTPKAGQAGTHQTSLQLRHGTDLIHSYTINTSAAATAEYDIKVYKDSAKTQPIEPGDTETWAANKGHYLYVTVVKHGTNDEVDTASVKVAVAPGSVLVPQVSPVTFTKGTPARIDFNPGSSASGDATITFSTTIDGQSVHTERKVYLGQSGSLEVVTPTPLSLSPGIDRTRADDQAVLDVRFNPRVNGPVPEIHFTVEGDGLTVLSKDNTFVTAGALTPTDPEGTGDFRIRPVLSTEEGASGNATITFSIDKTKYPEDAGKWKPVTVTVNISGVDHVTWSVAPDTLVDTGSHPTGLKTGLKACDARGKEMSSYALDVHIVSGEVEVSFTDNTLTHRLNGPDSSGWAHLPEMIVGQKAGTFRLQATLPGASQYLKDELPLKVIVAERPGSIVMHPEKDYAVDFDDLDSGLFTHDSGRYAQLNDAGSHAVHTGSVTFTILDTNNTAGAKMKEPDSAGTPTVKTVPVNANGRALWPDIILGNPTGTFTLEARHPDVAVTQNVKITVS